jgi:hypothetical protein
MNYGEKNINLLWRTPPIILCTLISYFTHVQETILSIYKEDIYLIKEGKVEESNWKHIS